MLKLYIGNKNYSSWSMRPWVLMRQAGINFEEVMLRFDSFEPESSFKQQALALSPTGRVPLLLEDGLVIWDSLAICEYLACALMCSAWKRCGRRSSPPQPAPCCLASSALSMRFLPRSACA